MVYYIQTIRKGRVFMLYDVIIIGMGPAGISAALYVKRAGMSCFIIGKDGGALEKAEKIENYYGLENVVSGHELIETGKKQAKKLGAELINAEAVGINWDGNYKIETTAGEFSAKAVILAVGSARNKAKIEGISDFEGMGVSYCAVCDAFFYRNKTVAVLGNGEYANHEIKELLPTSAKVYLLTDGKNPETDFSSVEIKTEKIKKLYGEGKLQGIEFENGEKLEIDGLFVALGTAGAADFAKKIGAETENNKIIVDEKMRTNLPGLFAAGDCIGGVLQVSVAVGEGAVAAMSAIEFVRKN